MSAEAALQVQDLHVRLQVGREAVYAVSGASFTLRRGSILALVGESGSGKSMTARALLGLLPANAGATGRALIDGLDLLKASGQQLREVRGTEVAIAFQNAASALNPIVTIGTHLRETIDAHRPAAKGNWREIGVSSLARAGLRDPESLLDAYPFELSGGQQQRVALALAIALRPTVLLADEITTALDVTTQAEVLDELRRLAKDEGQAVLLITHDLAVASDWADDLAVMYEGTIVESGPTDEIITAPRHPYTTALLACQPSLSPDAPPLAPIRGAVEVRRAPLRHCPFLRRCSRAVTSCQTEPPPELSDGPHCVACHQEQQQGETI